MHVIVEEIKPQGTLIRYLSIHKYLRDRNVKEKER